MELPLPLITLSGFIFLAYVLIIILRLKLGEDSITSQFIFS